MPPPHRARTTGGVYSGASPSKNFPVTAKSGRPAAPRNVGPWPEVRDQLNRILRGRSNYFSYGTTIMANRAVDNYSPPSVAATAGVVIGRRAVGRALRPTFARCRAADGPGVKCAVSSSAAARACTHVAQVRRATTSGCPGWVGHTRFAQPDAGGRLGPRRPPSVAATAGGRMGGARAEGTAIKCYGAVPLWPTRNAAPASDPLAVRAGRVSARRLPP